MIGVLEHLKLSSSPDDDGIHNELLLNLPSIGLDLLLKLNNAFLANGLQSCLKSVTITMIPKTDISTSSPSDYMPISLKSFVEKIIERIVRNRLYRFLEE